MIFYCRFFIFFVNDDVYYVEYLWRKMYYEFLFVGKLKYMFVWSKKKKFSYLCNKILMVVFVWVKEVIVGLF